MEGQNSMPTFSILTTNEQDPTSMEQSSSNNHSVRNNEDSGSTVLSLRRWGYIVWAWHFKQCPHNRTLLIFRIISIVLFLILSIIDTVAFSAFSNPPSTALQFIWGADYALYDIATIIYCSGAPVFGISFEIYLFVMLAILNVIFQSRNCDDMQLTVVFLVRVICLVVAVELAYRNFRRLSDDLRAREKSARAMLYQSLLFSLSILFFASGGIRTVFEGALNKCEFQHFTCGLIDMDAPSFEAHAPCDPLFVDYVSSREELRILRDWLMLNIAFYSIFNHALLDFVALRSRRTRWILARLILLVLFLGITASILVVNIIPFQLHKIKIVFDVIECLLYAYILFLMIFNLIRTEPGTTLNGRREPIEENPHILPKV